MYAIRFPAAVRLAALMLTCLVATTSAQIPADYPAIAVSPTTDCESAPDLWSTGALTRMEALGTYDFWLYPILAYQEEIAALSVAVVFPEDWELLDLELCYGSLEDLQIQGSTIGLTIGFPPGFLYERPAVRMRIAATSPGYIELDWNPFTSRYAYRHWDDSWHDAWGASYMDALGNYVVIGPHDPCQRPPLGSPGDWCGLTQHFDPGWIELPTILNLTVDTTIVEELDAYAEECSALASCGGVPPYTIPCLDSSPTTDLDWLQLTGSALDPGPFTVTMTVDTHGLSPGSYTANVQLVSSCGPCATECRTIELNVEPLPVESSTWGRIKAMHRD